MFRKNNFDYQKILTEVNTLRNVHHPCIISLIEVIEDDERLGVAGVHHDGGNLQQALHGGIVLAVPGGACPEKELWFTKQLKGTDYGYISSHPAL